MDELPLLREELSALKKQHEALLAISQDPALEITTLRDQVISMSSRCAELEEEISLLHLTRSNSGKKDRGRFQAEALVQSVMEAKPMLTESDHTLLRVVVPIVERMWNSDSKPTGKTEQKNWTLEVKRKDEEISKLRKDAETMKEKIRVFEASMDKLTSENVKLRSEVTELESQRESLIVELAEKEEETEEYRPVAKQKYRLECEKQELQLANERLQRQCERAKREAEDLAQHSAAEAQRAAAVRSDLEGRIAALSAEVKALETEGRRLQAVCDSQRTELERMDCDAQKYRQEHTELEAARERVDALTQELEDVKTEHGIYVKKSLNEVKSLKSEIAKERTQLEEMRAAYDQCRRELERIQDIKTAHAKVAAASISEKKFVETLREQVSTLEGKIKYLTLMCAQSEEVKARLIQEMQKTSELNKEVASLKAALSRGNR